MILTGENFIGFKRSAAGTKSFQAFGSSSNDLLPGNFTQATKDELDKVLELADTAFAIYRAVNAFKRAAFLDAIAALNISPKEAVARLVKKPVPAKTAHNNSVLPAENMQPVVTGAAVDYQLLLRFWRRWRLRIDRTIPATWSTAPAEAAAAGRKPVKVSIEIVRVVDAGGFGPAEDDYVPAFAAFYFPMAWMNCVVFATEVKPIL